MATNKDPIFLVSTKNPAVQITDADTTVAQQIFTAGTEGGAVTQLTATTDDTSAIIVVISINDGSSSFIIGEVSVAAGSGTDGANDAVDLLNSDDLPILDADGSLILQAGYILEVSAKVTITAATVLDIVGVGGDY